VEEKKEPEVFDQKKRSHSKVLSVLDGTMYSISAGLTGNFISAFAIALGASNFVIALLATLPSLIASVVQLSVEHVMKVFRTRKSFIVFFAVLQAFTWLPLIFAPQLQHAGGWLLLFVTLNAILGMLIGPIWNSFISDVVEENERGRFFGMRNMFTGLSAFVATLAAGWLLSVLRPINPFLGFSLLFVLAFAFRLLSAYFLSRMDEPPETGLKHDVPDIPRFLRTANDTPLGRFTIFLMLFNIAVYVASPFFPIYQLSILKLDYFTFTLLASASAITSFVTMIFWGKYVDRIGSKRVLVASGFLIPLVPLFYPFAPNLWSLGIIEAFSGMIWAGFSLSVSTYLFDATEREVRTRQMAEYTLLVQVAVFFGALIGSGLLGIFDQSSRTAFVTVFILSAFLRFAVMLGFYKTLRELRIVEVPIKNRVFKKFISIKPQHGITYEPAVESSPAEGWIAKEEAKDISDEMHKFAARMQHKKKRSPIKELERQEDEADTKEYLKKLKKQ
jgi:MFS family permease